MANTKNATSRIRKTKSNSKLRDYLLSAAIVLIVLAIPLSIVYFDRDNRKSEAASIQPVGQPGGWNLVFSDEFDGTTLDTTKWVHCFPWGEANGCQSTTTPNNTYRPDNVIVGNGILRLQARKGSFVGTDGKTYPYSSGMITTAGYDGTSSYKYMNKYGYMEARIKVPKGQGLWPAFWNLAPEGNWPPEIDIMENLTSSSHNTFQHQMHFHYCDNYQPTVDCPSGHDLDSGAQWTSPVDLSLDYHVYAVDWSPTAIRWYVDGIERRAAFTDASKIPAEFMYLILQLQVGGSWPGEADATTPFPSYMDVDYIRVWEKCTTNCAPTATPAPGSQSTIIPTGSNWKYLDNNTRPAGWEGLSFNDSTWNSGNAELGYGDGDETTVVSYGSSSTAKYPTTYFRKTFTANPSDYSALELGIKRDDGAVVYLNGTEVYRTNMPTGTISHTTWAASSIDDNTFFTVPVPANLLQTGTNVIAVEVHQSDAGSSDISLDFRLTGTLSGSGSQPTNTPVQPTNTPLPLPTATPTPIVSSDTTPPTVAITSPANGSTVTKGRTTTINASASDNVGVNRVQFSVGTSLICTDSTAPYSCSWSVPGKKNTTYTLRATAYDAAGNSSSSSVNVTAR